VLSLLACALLAALDWRWLLLPGAYIVALLVVGGLMWWGERGWLRRTVVQAAVLGTMHTAYGTGFLLKLVHILP
jgi:hypothetical protein